MTHLQGFCAAMLFAATSAVALPALAATPAALATEATPSGAAALRGLPDFADLAERQAKVVVNISTTQIVRRRAMPHGLPFDDEEMPEFFRRFMPHGMPGVPGMPKESERHSLGSGFLISEDGYILTNAHVVDGADEITVRLSDKREFPAKIVGADKRTDVALIKIDAKGLPAARLGNSEKLRVGEWVVAIGSPFGLESTVTAGIVSAKGRSLPQENYVPFIQTDVAVNPGNSGGPLFNLQGEVIGINSQIYSRSGGYMGLSFAIPIDVAMSVQQQLRESGHVSRGRLGVVIQEVTRELAESFGLEKATGALVNSVEPGGPADKAGVEAGDVILRFNGKTVTQSAELPRLVAALKPGSKVTLQLWRKGSSHDLAVTLGEIQDDPIAATKGGGKGNAATNRLGLSLRELTAEQKKQAGVSYGLMVEDADGVAARELRPGDLILALIHKGVAHELKSVAQFNKLLAQFPKNVNVTLLVRRGDMQTFVTIKGA